MSQPAMPAETHAQLTHTRSCSALTPGEDCTCCLKERQNTQTAETMHAAWRKRAEEAEQELAKLKEPRKPTKMQVKSLCWRSTQYGSLHWWDETQVIGKGFARFPSGDITGEVEA